MEEGYHWVNDSTPSEKSVKNYRNSKHITSFGSYGRNSGQFLDPLGISSGDDFLCLTDPIQNAVSIYSHTNSFIDQIYGEEQFTGISQFNSTKQRHFSSVFDVTVHTPTSTILVTDPVRKSIHAMDKDGNPKNGLLDESIKLLKADTLAGVCVTNNGLIAVTDSELGNVIVCGTDGDVKTIFGGDGDKSGELCMPQFLCWDGYNDRLLVSDTANSRIQIFTLDGRHLSSFGQYGNKNGCFQYPSGIQTDEHGRIFVVDQGLHNIQIFDKTGDWLHTFGGPGVADGLFHSPKGLTILPNGDLFVTDSLNCRVQHFS